VAALIAQHPLLAIALWFAVAVTIFEWAEARNGMED
jgi:hypothetical protein